MPIFDLHSHISLQPYYMNDERNGDLIPMGDHWTKREKRFKHPLVSVAELFPHTVARFSQTHLDSAIIGDVKCVVNSLYALERGFLKLGEHLSNEDGLIDSLLAYITGADVYSINRIQKKESCYFDEMSNEYKNIIGHQAPVTRPERPQTYKIVSNYNEIVKNPGISIILSIEGAQSFANNIYCDKGDFIDPIEAEDHKLPQYQDYMERVIENIKTVKNLQFPVFYVTPSHHYYNHLAGLSESIPLKFGVQSQSISIRGNSVFDMGITVFGEEAFELLLARSIGNVPSRRILIDVKHLSPNARVDYFDMIQGQDIPVIASHTAVNGRPRVIDWKDDSSRAPFNPGSINLFDDEISIITKSKGLMGIMLDEKRLYDEATGKVLKDLKKHDPRGYKQKCTDIILSHILHIAKVTGGEGLNHVCLGTDFDGAINPLDIFPDFSSLPGMRTDLITTIHEGMPGIQNYDEEKALLRKSPETCVEKFLWGNAMNFLQKYFTDEYLKGSPSASRPV